MVQVFDKGGNQARIGFSKNISFGGIFVATKRRWLKNTVIWFRIVHKDVSVDVLAQAVHEQPDGVGFKFISKSGEFDQNMRRIIDYLLSEGAGHDDRRRSLRIKTRAPVVLEYAGMSVDTKLVNLSNSGALVEAQDPPDVGDNICIFIKREFQTNEADRSTGMIGCSASVVRHCPEGFGVQFTYPSKKFYEVISQIRKRRKAI
jgi:hypothetical protein